MSVIDGGMVNAPVKHRQDTTQLWLTACLWCWLASEDEFLSLLFCSHAGWCCQSQDGGTAQCNEQDYQGKLAGIVWYQRKSSQWGIFSQHSHSFIHCLCAQSDSAHSPAVKPCHYPLVCFCLAGDRTLLLLVCVTSCIYICVHVCVLNEQIQVCCVWTVHVRTVCMFIHITLTHRKVRV